MMSALRTTVGLYTHSIYIYIIVVRESQGQALLLSIYNNTIASSKQRAARFRALAAVTGSIEVG
jgi:hypothetical protein